MQISKLLLECADRFNRAADLVCVEWSESEEASGICCPVDPSEFSRLVRAKIAVLQVQTIQPVVLPQHKISA